MSNILNKVKTMGNTIGRTTAILLLPITCSLLSVSCDKDVFDIGSDPAEGTTFKSYDDSPISNVLEADGRFNEFVGVMKYAGLYNALNQSTTGVSFTAFVPTDSAMNVFYNKLGKKVTEETKDYARSFVLYHAKKDSVLPDAFIKLTSFRNLKDDNIKVAVDTLHAGQVKLSNTNSTAQVVEMGISASNGKIYVLSGALTPLVETVYDRISESGNYNIMLEAMKETGWTKKLATITDTTVVDGKQQINSYSYTVLGITDATFNSEGINSLADLKAKLVKNSTEAVPEDSLLREYVAYHILDGKYTMSNLGALQGSDLTRLWSSFAKNQVFTMTTDTTATTVAEKYTFNNSSLPTHFVEENSNVIALNGYLHQINTWMPVWEPEQQRVLWDFADNSAVKDAVEKAGNEYQPAAWPTKQVKTSLNNVNAFTYTNTESKNTNFDYIDYYTVLDLTNNGKLCGVDTAYNHDCVVFNVGNTGTVSMVTPTIVKGKYKVVLNVVYISDLSFMRKKEDGSGGTLEISFDGKDKKYVAPYTMIPARVPTLADPTVTKSVMTGVYPATLYDEIEFDNTSSHTFLFKVKDGAASTNSKFSLQFDTMEFIPVE